VAELCQKSAVVALYSVPCWGFPLILTMVVARFYLLGYAETVDVGNAFCFVVCTCMVFLCMPFQASAMFLSPLMLIRAILSCCSAMNCGLGY
jgi:hypothetical protein